MHSSLSLACPDCQGALEATDRYFTCRSCANRFPSWLGIVSLIHGSERDLDPISKLLLDAFPHSSFEDLLKLRTPSFSTPDAKLLERYRAYRQNMMQRGRAFYEMARISARSQQENVGNQVAIALGCGVGASMACMARDFAHVLGVDPSLPDLLLARKAFDELGARNVTLAHCFGERMPVSTAAIDFIIAENVLEHVQELGSVLQEVGRVLKPDAVFVGDCANRFNMLRPEPHVHLWGVGLLPRQWQARYVMWRRNFQGYDKSVHLKSYGHLLSELRSRLGPTSTIECPRPVTFGFSKRIDDVLAVIDRLPLLRVMLLSIFPVFVAVGRRSRTAPH
jgi:ubiquinone/menaquinone biosynthesis C-methylase UbiE